MELKNKILMTAIAAALAFSSFPAFAGAAAGESSVRDTDPVAAGDIAGLKDILSKLVRQDELLDEAVENLEGANGPVAVKDLSAVRNTLRVVRKNLDHISWLNKEHLAAVKPGPETGKYARAILSYSGRISSKSARISAIAARAASAKNKSALRDAPSSGAPRKRAGGKSVKLILAEKDAWAGIAAETKNLKNSSYKLKATSRWLHVASK